MDSVKEATAKSKAKAKAKAKASSSPTPVRKAISKEKGSPKGPNVFCLKHVVYLFALLW